MSYCTAVNKIRVSRFNCSVCCVFIWAAFPACLCCSQSVAILTRNGHELTNVTDQNTDASQEKLGACPLLVDKWLQDFNYSTTLCCVPLTIAATSRTASIRYTVEPKCVSPRIANHYFIRVIKKNQTLGFFCFTSQSLRLNVLKKCEIDYTVLLSLRKNLNLISVPLCTKCLSKTFIWTLWLTNCLAGNMFRLQEYRMDFS
jgi:hypothetical protein